MESKPKQSKSNILIVENDPNDAFLIRRAVNHTAKCGHAMICRNPSEAIAVLKGAGMYANREIYPIPDLVITDMRMGDESGMELIEWIREQSAPLRDTPIVVLSGSSSPLQLDAAWKVGANAVHKKPTRLEDLQELLNAIAGEFCKSSED